MRSEKYNFDEYSLIDFENFIDEDKSLKMLEELQGLEYKFESQQRHGHYSHVFKSEDPSMPDETDSFAAQFYTATDREGSKTFNHVFQKNIVSLIKEINPEIKYFLKPNIVKIKKDCFFRSHNDGYAGDIGYTLFISKRWKWDFGGILTFVSNAGAKPIFPNNNRLIIRDEKSKPQHFVPPVTKWAGDSEYFLMLGWAAKEILGGSKLRGDYLEL